MPSASPEQISLMVSQASLGDQNALSKLIPIVYSELRRLAGSYLRKERAGHSLQATALVHEAYLRLLRDEGLQWENRAHFLAIAARAMRQILVERARSRSADKRGGGQPVITLNEAVLGKGDRSLNVLALDEALQSLAAQDAGQAEVVELRFFGGLTIEETAAVMKISPATVKRRWDFSKAWLRREMSA